MERLRPHDQLITLPKTGLRIIPPMETQQNIAFAREQVFPSDKKNVIWSEREKARLRLLVVNPIYRKRHPGPEFGKAFMHEVDHERRELLFSYAQSMSNTVVTSWEAITKEKNIAVVLFGSVATGLVKHVDHPCPSNIDLAVLGDFTADERDLLYDAIRPKRQEIQQQILADCSHVQSTEKNPGNVGVTVQHMQKVIKSDYSGALEYIAGNATPMHDPAAIWKTIESAALDVYIARENRKKPHHQVIFWDRRP